MTPTSAMIATHILAIPIAARIRQITLTARAKTMFCFTIPRHFREILIAFGILSGSSSIRTISAASIAASDPKAPMAIPMSARDNTGASLIPSPTNANFFLPVHSASNSSTALTLSAGSSSARKSVSPTSDATFSATAFASPVSMTVFSTPTFRRPSIASFDVGFNSSEITICPAYSPSSAIWMIVPVW